MSTIEKALNRLRKGGETTVPEPDSAGPDAPAGGRPHDSATPLTGTSREPLTIDLRHLRRHGIYPPAYMEETLRDQYRRIKRPLVANATGRGAARIDRGNLIMVTSAVAGEGKTFTSLNLALSIAHDPDHSVTLVDGDVARAHASKLLGLEDKPGLIDLLADENLTPGDLVIPTTVESLSILPAGRHHTLSEELLSSNRMERVISALADRAANHIVLFDSAPLLLSPDALTLSSSVGQIVVVVKAYSTLRHQVSEAVEQLDPNKAINMVLNQSLGGPGGDEYGGYYGKPYGER